MRGSPVDSNLISPHRTREEMKPVLVNNSNIFMTFSLSDKNDFAIKTLMSFPFWNKHVNDDLLSRTRW